MKKPTKWLAVFAAFALAFGFAACSSGNDDSASGSNATNTTDNSGSGGETTRTEATGKIGKYEKPYVVGDIVFNDGSATPYTTDLTLTDAQKEAAIAVIFYVGTGEATSGSNENILGKKTLGVGLSNTQGENLGYDKDDGVKKTLAWAQGDAKGYDEKITTIECDNLKTGSYYTYTYSDFNYTDGTYSDKTFYLKGDFDGSDNYAALKTFLGEYDDTQTEGNYPAFEWADSYGANHSLADTDYASSWYLPSVVELCILYGNLATVDTSLQAAGGTQLAGSYYWSSSQYAAHSYFKERAWCVNFYLGILQYASKDDDLLVCAIRSF